MAEQAIVSTLILIADPAARGPVVTSSSATGPGGRSIRVGSARNDTFFLLQDVRLTGKYTSNDRTARDVDPGFSTEFPG